MPTSKKPASKKRAAPARGREDISLDRAAAILSAPDLARAEELAGELEAFRERILESGRACRSIEGREAHARLALRIVSEKAVGDALDKRKG